MGGLDLSAIKTYRNLLQLGFQLQEERGPVEPEERFIERAIAGFIVPGPARLQLQEWLLDTFEPGVLEDPDIQLPGLSPSQRIAAVYDQLGVHYDSVESIEGHTGAEASLRLLQQLSDFVITSRSVERPNETLSNAEANVVLENSGMLLTYICDNRERVFFSEPKLFPPTFPARNLQAAKCDKVGELQRALDKWQAELSGVKSQVALLSKDFIESEQFPPSSEQLAELRHSLGQFVSTLRLFKSVYEEKLQPELQTRYFGSGLAPHEEALPGLGREAASCLELHCKITDLMKALEDVWSSLQVCMDNGDVAQVQGQDLFGDQTIAELSMQVKELRDLIG